MSWQSYIDDQLLASGCMYASINGHDGALWASSTGFVVLPEECTSLATLLQGTDLSPIATTGFEIAGQKYTFTRGEVDDDEGGASYLQGRCKEDGKSAQGVIVFCTPSALIIGVHDPSYSNGNSFGHVNNQMGRIADYMLENGF
eukprot:GFKZ01013824.1.p1 GENE.GFKZ01013824.1~~GFKZ01013824.1.p1  ORF type:complete len:144 (+),score=13.90 GFKZ01013824.1:247-678(+)